MKEPGTKIAGIFALAGAIVSATIVVLFYQLRVPAERSITFSFTAWFTTLQSVLFFGSLALVSLSRGAEKPIVPARASLVTSTVLYNIVALATILAFNVWLLPDIARPATYYTIGGAETALWVALVVLLRMVGIVHQASHAEAIATRQGVETLTAACDRIVAAAEAGGWQISQQLRDLSDRIRFSEGIRRNAEVAADVRSRLGRLEQVVASRANTDGQASASQLLTELRALAARRG